MHSLLLVCVLSIVATLCSAHHAEEVRKPCEFEQNQPPPKFKEPYRRLCLEDWALNRTYFVSRDAPIARALEKQPESVPTLRTLLKFVRSEHNRAIRLQREKRSGFVRFPEEPCNIQGVKAERRLHTVNVSLSRYGWGLMESQCTTGLVTPVNREVVDAMEQYEKTLNEVKDEAARSQNFSNPTTFLRFNYKTTLDTCTLWHYTAFRYNGTWGLNTPITNDNLTRTLPDWHRHYFVEVLRLTSDNRIQPIPMTLRVRPNKAWKKDTPFNTNWTKGATTHMATWGGIPASSLFESTLFLANNPAIAASMRNVSATIDQIEDATTASGMAILIMPIFLTAVPVAIFGEIDSKALLLYTIATDILTVLPLGIKGIELLGYSTASHEAARTYVYGGLNDVEPAALETWYARCNATDHVKILGKLFISLAVLFMIIGIAVELVAKRIFEKRRRYFAKKGQQIARGKPLWSGAVCGECDCLEGAKRV